MKRLASIIIALLGVLVSCANENLLEDNHGQGGAPSVTIDSKQVSAISVVLMGKANIGSTAASDLRVGFQYSTSAGILPSNSITVEAEEADANYNYTTGISGLEPGTTYYYRSFVLQNGQYFYGESKQFRTKDLESLLQTKDATEIEATRAVLNAYLNLDDVIYSSIEYGFYWGSEEESLTIGIKGENVSNEVYTASLLSLAHKTQYWFKAYVKLDNQVFYGETKSFTSDVVHAESVSLNRNEYSFYTIGKTFKLKATVLPEDATDKSVEWISNNKDVAIVDADGLVTAVGNGTATIEAKTTDLGKTASCIVIVSQYVTEITLNKTYISLFVGESEIVSVSSIMPENANDKSVTWTSSDESIASIDKAGKVTAIKNGMISIKATANDGSGKFASCWVRVVKLPCPEDAVDLGVSVYWAKCNLEQTGFVSTPEEGGTYYAWGETRAKTYYDWSTYIWCNGSDRSFTKYNTNSLYGTVDNLVELQTGTNGDDVASRILGGSWRIPSDSEWAELSNHCNFTWTKQNNRWGLIITSKFNGNSIFLPAVGYCLYGGGAYNPGPSGWYWSSTLDTDEPNRACLVRIDHLYLARRKDERRVGNSIRPVCD